MNTPDPSQAIFFENQQVWHEWLAKNQVTSDGVWIKFAKKASGIPTLVYAEALDEALCYGWIDGMVKSIDETYYMQRFTPRRPRSMWSKRNIDKVAVLITEGRMQPAGQAQIDAAKMDGRWDQAYDSPKNMQMSADFSAALAKNKKAEAFYKTLNKTDSFTFLWRIQTAKKPETRLSRIETFVQMLADGKTFR